MTYHSEVTLWINYYSHAFDKEDGDLTDKIKVDGQIDTSKSGKYQIKYHVTDSDGAIKISTRYIEVK